MSLRWIPAIGERAAPVERLQRRGDDLAGGREEDGGVERFGRRDRRCRRPRRRRARGRAGGPRRSGSSRGPWRRRPAQPGRRCGRSAEPVDAEPAARWQRARRSARKPMIPAQSSGAASLVSKRVGDAVGVALVDDGELGVPAVVVPAGEPRCEAQVLRAAPAEAAGAACLPEPRDADALAQLEPLAPGPRRRRSPRSRARARHRAGAGRGRPRPGAGRSGTRRTRGPSPAPPEHQVLVPDARSGGAGQRRSVPAGPRPTRASDLLASAVGRDGTGELGQTAARNPVQEAVGGQGADLLGHGSTVPEDEQGRDALDPESGRDLWRLVDVHLHDLESAGQLGSRLLQRGRRTGTGRTTVPRGRQERVPMWRPRRRSRPRWPRPARAGRRGTTRSGDGRTRRAARGSWSHRMGRFGRWTRSQAKEAKVLPAWCPWALGRGARRVDDEAVRRAEEESHARQGRRQDRDPGPQGGQGHPPGLRGHRGPRP